MTISIIVAVASTFVAYLITAIEPQLRASAPPLRPAKSVPPEDTVSANRR